MSVLVAVPDSAEGLAALTAAGEEATLLGTDLVIINVGLSALPKTLIPTDVVVELIERSGAGQRDPFDTVLDEVRRRRVHRLVIGVRRRSPTGKALLGSLSQRLLLQAPVPVLAVKINEEYATEI
ncbi:universal stress protein [Gordonia sp. Z-3]|uniref:universal stress protein n=1 Tax=Gordonia sp. Z-3 TaxID=3115408 RepID=UPI002E298E53|nr:universal stress protein [Gordonia sp. Z-3]MED5802758.1 universal stress protein [Gordonia sp. Z-3]